jgi:quercetin dioxygenase-like cupin family protein
MVGPRERESVMFYKKSDEGYHSRIQGIDQKTLVYGEKTLLTEFRLARGSLVPKHSHPYEQTGYLISGHMVFIVGHERRDTRPGDSWCIATDAEHSAEVIEDSVAVEVFSPVREDYLPDKK